MNSYTGKWHATFGPMDLEQTGDQVQGSYNFNGTPCTIEGTVSNGRLTFTYHEPTITGEGWFDLSADGLTFSGQWRPLETETWHTWRGERLGFPGLWETDFGMMRLVQDGDRIHGFYEVGGTAVIEGRILEDGKFHFTYQEPNTKGEGVFELAPHGMSFQGVWHSEYESTWSVWHGRRVTPQEGLTWLVVLEAPWQRFLSEKEYAFGDMLREFFARVPSVQVRHRSFNNEASLKKLCHELMYLAEPVVLLVATHGLPGCIPVDGKKVALESIVDSLKCVSELKLLHLSACLTLADDTNTDHLTELGRLAKFPITGYSTSVDWGASAIIEFTYLDMLLSRKLTVPEAVEQLHLLLPFVGDEAPDGSIYRPAGFRMVLPTTEEAPPRQLREGVVYV